jgi:putative endonuclease
MTAAVPEQEVEWQVYLLQCADGSLYAGITIDINRRLQQHNGQLPGGARYTRGRRPAKVVWSEVCGSKSSALQREAAVKRLSRRQKQALIAAFDGDDSQ